MLSITLADQATVLRIAQTFAPLTAADFAPVLQALRCENLASGQSLLHMGQIRPQECFVLDGLLRTSVADACGREVTLGFHVGPCVMPPAITRSLQECSRVDCVALEVSRVALFDPHTLSQAMADHAPVHEWGNAVLRHELLRMAQREWALAALAGAQRLQQLRAECPGLEDRVPHRMIASYLGMTPVNFSRLRNPPKARAPRD
ncbi:MAG: Crp/Fnr family transcriptional regulator [Giesbergeria sp.]